MGPQCCLTACCISLIHSFYQNHFTSFSFSSNLQHPLFLLKNTWLTTLLPTSLRKFEQPEESAQTSTVTYTSFHTYVHVLHLTFPSATINCYELFIFLKPVSPLCTISHLLMPAQWHGFCTNFSSPLKNTNMMLFLQQKHKQLPLIPHLNQTTALFLFPFTTKFLKVIVFTYSLTFFFSVFSWTHHK